MKAPPPVRVSAVPVEDKTASPADLGGAPDIVRSSAAGLPKPAGGSRTAAAVALLRDALRQGPVAAREIERLANAAGFLDEGKSLGESKVFRTARKSLGIKTYQRPKETISRLELGAAGQATSEAQPAAHLGP